MSKDNKVLTKGTEKYFSASWLVDGLDFEHVYDRSYIFGKKIDDLTRAAYPDKISDLDVTIHKPGSRGIVRKSKRGVIIFSSEGDIFQDEELENYDTWEKTEPEFRNVAGKDVVFSGFRLGFLTCDVLYEEAELLKMSGFKDLRTQISVISHFDISDYVKEFVRETNPDCDTSELDRVDRSRLRKLTRPEKEVVPPEE